MNLFEPWPRSYATRKLREFGNDPAFNLDLSTHAESRMVERNLTSSDARCASCPEERACLYGRCPREDEREVQICYGGGNAE